MTLILPRTKLAKDFITGGQDNVGIRVPSHTAALQLLKEFEAQGGSGVAAPSANRFGAVSPTTVEAVEQELGSYLSPSDQILDGGNCEVGIESTIIDCRYNSPSILRPGAVTFEMIQEVCEITIDPDLKNSLEKKIKVSGLLESHYSPNAEIHIYGIPVKGEGLIALDSIVTPKGVVRLANPKTIEEYAQILYTAFRLADKKGLKRVFVVPPTGNGISVAINNRLIRAAFNKVE
jgi:L-threonylcarbamoyladenylate synthase